MREKCLPLVSHLLPEDRIIFIEDIGEVGVCEATEQKIEIGHPVHVFDVMVGKCNMGKGPC